MGSVLSQDEVDSLLGGISKGKVETEADVPAENQGLEVYDFSQTNGPVHNRLPGLGIINERFVTFLRESLSSSTGLGIDITIAATESVKFGDFCRSLPLPTSFNIFKMEPLRGFALLVLEGPLVFSFVDTLFGGRGASHVKVEGRGFTTIETTIIQKIVHLILKDLERAWSEFYNIKTSFKRSEMDPQFAAIVPRSDAVIVNKFTVELENASGLITICTPHSAIEPVKEKLKKGLEEQVLEVDQAARHSIEKRLKELSVNMSCTLGWANLNGRELLELKVDDVIPLEQKVGDPVVVMVEGVEKFCGYPGSHNSRKAIKIIERSSEE